ncbi:hypothetical protein LNQ52_00655 [Klebsiella pneumoniae subsp. pneumoniae]|nr:hypothetical protein [Klebsiella pneumoniae subsp. pneumoniae]
MSRTGREFRDAIRITREIANQPALDKYRGREISPGIECQSDAELDEFVRQPRRDRVPPVRDL